MPKFGRVNESVRWKRGQITLADYWIHLVDIEGLIHHCMPPKQLSITYNRLTRKLTLYCWPLCSCYSIPALSMQDDILWTVFYTIIFTKGLLNLSGGESSLIYCIHLHSRTSLGFFSIEGIQNSIFCRRLSIQKKNGTINHRRSNRSLWVRNALLTKQSKQWHI